MYRLSCRNSWKTCARGIPSRLQRKCFLALLFPKIHAVELSTILKILKFSLFGWSQCINRFLYRNTQNTISKSYLSLLQRVAEIAFISYIFGVINVLIMHDFKYSIISNSLGESSVCTACHAETDERYVQGAILPACNEQRKSFLPFIIPHAFELSTISKVLKFSLLWVITVYEPIFIQKYAKHDIKELSFLLATCTGNRFYFSYLRNYKRFNNARF